MVYKTKADPKGPTRHLGARGALKQTTFIRLQKNKTQLTVESAFEVLMAKLLDLSADVIDIQYQPFTLDIAHARVLLTHKDLKTHRESLKKDGATGIFYTPDFQVKYKLGTQTQVEVVEAKDSDWVPSVEDYYGEKLLITRDILQTRGVQFNIYELNNRSLYQNPLSTNINKLHCLKMQRSDEMGTLSPTYLDYLHHRTTLLETVENQSGVTVGELSKNLGIEPCTVWHLLIDEVCATDLVGRALGPMSQLFASKIAPESPSLFRSILLSLKSEVREAEHA